MALQGRCWGGSWPIPKNFHKNFHKNFLGPNFRLNPGPISGSILDPQMPKKAMNLHVLDQFRGGRWTLRPARPAGPRPGGRAAQPALQGRCWAGSWPIPKDFHKNFHKNFLGGLLENFHENFHRPGQIQKIFMKTFA